VKRTVREIRPEPVKPSKMRFETPPGDERRRTKVIPHAFGSALCSLMYAAMIRAADSGAAHDRIRTPTARRDRHELDATVTASRARLSSKTRV
jgi:hypothetical protein